ncbi:MAG: hypothetical protein FJX65_19870, partial [Alphaproteobacteria bacterium]|nr:hypothetical protein [Alphaproteobacteria bacterium]
MNALDPVEAAPAAVPTRAFQIRISRGLLLGFGGLVFLAVVIVLALGLWSAWRNTIELLREKSESTIGVVVARIEHYLDPAEHMLKHLGRQLETGAINPDDPAALGHYLSGALAATPQVRSVVFIAERGQMTFALRREEGVELQLVDVRGLPVLRAALDEARTRQALYWGDVIHPETARETLINVRYPVWRGTSYLGVLGATVRSVELARLLDDTARHIGGEAFVLYGDDQVIAHRKFLRGRFGLGPAHPLPTVAEVGDTILAQFVATGLAGRAPRLAERAPPRTAPAHPDDLSGPLRLAQSAAQGRPHHRRRPDRPRR